MNRPFQHRVARFYRVPQVVAFYARTLAQFLIGAWMFGFLLLKGVTILGFWPGELAGDLQAAVRAAPVLGLVSGALLAAAAVELAYMLFTPGPDEAIDPLILGLAGTTILALSHHEQAAGAGGSAGTGLDDLMNGALILLLVAGLFLLFFLRWKVRQWFAAEEAGQDAAAATRPDPPAAAPPQDARLPDP
ncbi:MAG: hypothetical protein U1E53_15980 [Dongiaceae bacterium]